MRFKLGPKTFINRIKSKNVINGNIVVIDSALPNKNPIGPRNSDLIEFSKDLPGFKYFTMYPMEPGKSAWFSHGYGMDSKQFNENLKAFLKIYPQCRGKIELLSREKTYRFNLAYTYFLAETYTLLPFLEKNQIPFVFLLNPGGAFGINNDSSDRMLKDVFASKYFRKVIVNQKLFEDYLLKKKLCKREDLIYDFSGSVQFEPEDVLPKRYYKRDKPTFDICFVAAKYSPKGFDKGYDLFVEAAKKFASSGSDIRFHVVGGFDEKDIDVLSIKDKIKFYGYLPAAELPSFYSNMDIYVSPNRPFINYPGGSDGFPLSAGAMYCGVCGFNSDELNMNTEFSKDEVVIIKTKADDIVKKMKFFYNHPEELYQISKKGQKKAQLLYDIEKHIAGRIKLFNEVVGNR